MSDIPRNVTVHVNDDGMPQRLTVGDYEFDARHVDDGIAVSLDPGSKTPVYTLWLAFYVEGTITDPSGSLRIVREGDVKPFSNARPGPCGDVPDLPPQITDGYGRPFCSLDAGHAGCHKDEERGTVWREAR